MRINVFSYSVICIQQSDLLLLEVSESLASLICDEDQKLVSAQRIYRLNVSSPSFTATVFHFDIVTDLILDFFHLVQLTPALKVVLVMQFFKDRHEDRNANAVTG